MAMEAISSSAIILSSSSFSRSIFSPRVTDSPKFVRLHICSKKNNGDSDLQSDSNSTSIVPLFSNKTLSKDEAMGLVLGAASGRGWGMEGPPVAAGKEDGSGTEKILTFPWSLFAKSPRRRMRVAFTCNICGQRTTRAINPHAYRDGTVFVQVKCYVNQSFNYRDTSWNMGSKHELDDDADVFPYNKLN
ncbi:hypothetical protein L6164_024913 [Bauhinia variegata]|uniref:Uncharacterized protein n=1 Tax=Bauhinia variegata TaxID=167791 RepID=A0ACB9LZB4_BAUVA|nr:hypothetical protein L6164_024913 [Bauhinia variegata]